MSAVVFDLASSSGGRGWAYERLWELAHLAEMTGSFVTPPRTQWHTTISVYLVHKAVGQQSGSFAINSVT